MDRPQRPQGPQLAALNGNTHIRAFADVDSKAKLIGVKALLKARDEFKGIVDVQVVAFPQDGVVREPGTVDLIRQAMDLGADVVGGIPWIEYTDADLQNHIDEMAKIAQAYDKDLSMLVDDAGDAGLRTLEMLAAQDARDRPHRPLPRAPRAGHVPVSRALLPQGRRPAPQGRHGRRERPAHRPAARAGQGAARGGQPRLPRAGRHRGRLLSRSARTACWRSRS